MMVLAIFGVVTWGATRIVDDLIDPWLSPGWEIYDIEVGASRAWSRFAILADPLVYPAGTNIVEIVEGS